MNAVKVQSISFKVIVTQTITPNEVNLRSLKACTKQFIGGRYCQGDWLAGQGRGLVAQDAGGNVFPEQIRAAMKTWLEASAANSGTCGGCLCHQIIFFVNSCSGFTPWRAQDARLMLPSMKDNGWLVEVEVVVCVLAGRSSHSLSWGGNALAEADCKLSNQTFPDGC